MKDVPSGEGLLGGMILGGALASGLSLGWRWPHEALETRGPKYSMACEMLHGAELPW